MNMCFHKLSYEDFMLSNGRPVIPGCARRVMAHPDFGRSVNPISTRRDRLFPPSYYWHTQIFRPSDGPERYLFSSTERYFKESKNSDNSNFDFKSQFIKVEKYLMEFSFFKMIICIYCANNY